MTLNLDMIKRIHTLLVLFFPQPSNSDLKGLSFTRKSLVKGKELGARVVNFV